MIFKSIGLLQMSYQQNRRVFDDNSSPTFDLILHVATTSNAEKCQK